MAFYPPTPGTNLENITDTSQARANLGLGTAAVKNTGVTEGNVVEVQSGNKLPALDGSELTNLPTGGDVVDDTTPQLGGDLDVNGNKIVSVSDGDIDIEPNGAGKLNYSGNEVVNSSNVTDGNVVDGDQIDIDFTPSNYTPDATPSEASDVDDLAAHLYGIDNALAGAGGGSTVEKTLLTLTADDSAISVGGAVTWDTQTGDKTDYTISSGKITLPSGGTYTLEAWVHVNGATWSEWRWYDTTNTTYIGIKSAAYPPNYNAGTAASTNATAYVDTSGGDVDIELRCEAKSGTANVRSNGTKALITRIT